MSNKLKGLNDRQRAVVATMRMRLTEKEAMAFLKQEGFPMSAMTWYRIKAWLKATGLQRMHYIASIGFEQQHNARIENCELIEEQMWENYLLEKSPFKRVIILEKIQNLQPLISAYYDMTRVVLEKRQEQEKELEERTKAANYISQSAT